MRSFTFGALFALLGASNVQATPLDDYVWTPDGNYSWYDTGETIHGRNLVSNYTHTNTTHFSFSFSVFAHFIFLLLRYMFRTYILT